ncbi:thioredoxin domain-containing protein [Streptomyces paromomycinus]|uniref:DSBA oxidoreductase n=1 Tax=Streptomyces paromomycinus TaxID=92743 RepID=A0A401VY13_STREY|nr:thioredoxin domain-containing protein [Streptomyces paromomycinus]GCD41949.1 DSBA oxidoreductase [Streptomyces paromomycinus]
MDHAGGDSNPDTRTARERLKVERARDAGRRRARWRFSVVGAVVVVAAVIGVVFALGGGAEDEAAGKPLVVPANTVGEQRTSVLYGKADARHTLAVVVDPRSASCARMEGALGRTMRELAGKGAYRIEYRLATVEDDARGGQGSRRAVNALGAAADEGPEEFVRYLGAVLAGRSGREEWDGDALASADTLLGIAGRVDGLRTSAFDKAVRELTYLPWAKKVAAAHNQEGDEDALPAVTLDGSAVTVLGDDGAPVSPREFVRQVRGEKG